MWGRGGTYRGTVGGGFSGTYRGTTKLIFVVIFNGYSGTIGGTVNGTHSVTLKKHEKPTNFALIPLPSIGKMTYRSVHIPTFPMHHLAVARGLEVSEVSEHKQVNPGASLIKGILRLPDPMV